MFPDTYKTEQSPTKVSGTFYEGIKITSLVGILLVTIFFVTSSDSGSLVIDHLTSGGKLDSPVPQRIFWGVI